MTTTPRDSQTINVVVGGAVQHGGTHELPSSATVRDALDAAGGFARSERMWPSGTLNIRRPQPNRKVAVWTFDTADSASTDWQHFQLESGDFLVFQWHIAEST